MKNCAEIPKSNFADFFVQRQNGAQILTNQKFTTPKYLLYSHQNETNIE